MTESEAIEIVRKEKAYMDSHAGRAQSEAFLIAINALEKQIPKKPTFQLNLSDTTTIFNCQCGAKIKVHHDIGIMDNNDAPNYCKDCGNKIDWSE